MPEISAFRAIRYDFSRYPDLSSLIAPPYDVLEQSDKDALLSASDRNIVAIDLPHIPPKSAGPMQVYQAANDRLKAMLKDGSFIREPQPAVYLYHQLFEHAGQTYTRKMFIARVRLQPFSAGSIVPHEETFTGPKEDRLALMKATACNLSAVFGLYADPAGDIEAALAQTAITQPSATAKLDGVQNRVWIVTDGQAIKTITTAMANRKIFIADGHHRYSTALMYRDWLTQQRGQVLPTDHPANYVMFVLASMDDPGCLILPYHRVLLGLDLDTIITAWGDAVQPCGQQNADLTLFEGTTGTTASLKFTQRQLLDTLAPDKSDAWRSLDVAYLHRVLLDDRLHAQQFNCGTGFQPVKTPTVRDGPVLTLRYVKSSDAARKTAQSEQGVAMLLSATPMSQLRAVSEAGDLMPQKSTNFYPKLATGVTIHALSL